jgi:hypothetical protein
MARSTIRMLATATVLAAFVGAGQVGASDESSDLRSEMARLQAELGNVTAERDALFEEATARVERHQRSSAAQQMIIDIIANPAAFGGEDEVLDLLDDLAVPDATMDDVALGIADWRDAWQGTLFGAQADIQTWAKWLAEDGSIGGSLWTWSGDALNGAPFTLPGVDVSRYDDNGRTISVVVYWPYEEAEVECVIYQGNEGCAVG